MPTLATAALFMEIFLCLTFFDFHIFLHGFILFLFCASPDAFSRIFLFKNVARILQEIRMRPLWLRIRGMVWRRVNGVVLKTVLTTVSDLYVHIILRPLLEAFQATIRGIIPFSREKTALRVVSRFIPRSHAM